MAARIPEGYAQRFFVFLLLSVAGQHLFFHI